MVQSPFEIVIGEWLNSRFLTSDWWVIGITIFPDRANTWMYVGMIETRSLKILLKSFHENYSDLLKKQHGNWLIIMSHSHQCNFSLLANEWQKLWHDATLACYSVKNAPWGLSEQFCARSLTNGQSWKRNKCQIVEKSYHGIFEA